MKNKKDLEIINGEKMIDALFAYVTENKEKIVRALEIPNLQGEEKDTNTFWWQTQHGPFQHLIAGLVLASMGLPSDLFDGFYHDEEEEEVLYEA